MIFLVVVFLSVIFSGISCGIVHIHHSVFREVTGKRHKGTNGLAGKRLKGFGSGGTHLSGPASHFVAVCKSAVAKLENSRA